MAGPLDGLSIVELAGLGPGPFCGMILADLGADLVRVDRVDAASEANPATRYDLLNRGKRSIAVDVKTTQGVEIVMRLVQESDALLEGFRPGVAERLGIGPEECLARNPMLIYGRMTGWGQTGPMAGMAGHDIDYIAVSGALGSIGTDASPMPPLNLVGDFGGGGLLLAMGVMAALWSARASGSGQVVDASMVDGSALLMTSHHGYLAEGWWSPRRAANPLDGAAPYYTTYATSDGAHVAVGAIEPQFFSVLLEGLGLDPEALPTQNDREGWPRLRDTIAARFATRTRAEWESLFHGTDACVAPVLSMAEAPDHPHNRARRTFVEIDGVRQPGPAPRFSMTTPSAPNPPPKPGEHTDAVLFSLGYSPSDVGMLRRSGAVA